MLLFTRKAKGGGEAKKVKTENWWVAGWGEGVKS